jgi:hypothetical protein
MVGGACIAQRSGFAQSPPQPFLIGRLLNHTSETGGAASVTLSTYAVYDYAAEKREALLAWQNLLLRIVSPA